MYSFGGEMEFTARVRSSESIIESRLILEYDSTRSILHPQAGDLPDGYSLTIEDDQISKKIFPLSLVNYWWEVDLRSGNTILSAQQSFLYFDHRFSWSQLEKGSVILYSLGSDPNEENDAADLALIALGTISAELETPLPGSITLVIYPRLADFQFALGDRLHGWEGAVSNVESGVILLAAASGAEGRQTLAVLIPHEITHVLLAAKWKSAYRSLPLWLVEGTAAGYEMGPRPEADLALREAVDQGRLIPVQTFCRVFPAEEKPALLAYAESKSFAGFLKQTYGVEAVRRAMAEYAAGAECGSGLKSSTGKMLGELESDWISTLAIKKIWIPPAWILVLAGFGLLAGVLAVRLLIHRRKHQVPARKEEAG